MQAKILSICTSDSDNRSNFRNHQKPVEDYLKQNTKFIRFKYIFTTILQQLLTNLYPF